MDNSDSVLKDNQGPTPRTCLSLVEIDMCHVCVFVHSAVITPCMACSVPHAKSCPILSQSTERVGPRIVVYTSETACPSQISAYRPTDNYIACCCCCRADTDCVHISCGYSHRPKRQGYTLSRPAQRFRYAQRYTVTL